MKIIKITCAILAAALFLTAAQLTAFADTAVSEVNILNFEFPVIGETSGDMPKLDVPRDADYFLGDYYYCRASTDEPLDMDEPFIEGERYFMTVHILPEENCVFSNNASITIGGETDQGEIFVRPYEIVIKTVPLTPFYGRICEVVINNFRLPRAGDYFAFLTKPEIPADAKYDFGYAWYDERTDSYMSGYDVFRSGRTYYFGAAFEPNEGYCFSSNTAYRVNGDDLSIDPGDVLIQKDYIEMWSKPIVFDEEEYDYISYIEVTGLNMPKLGQTAAENLTSIAVSDNCTPANIVWVNDSQDRVMNGGEEFQEGYEYYVSFSVYPASGYSFDQSSFPAVTINGKTDLYDVDNTRYQNGMLVFFTLNVTAEDESAAINEINIIGFKAPLPGQTFAEAKASISVPEDARYVLKYIGCLDTDTGSMMYDRDTFKAGGTYRFIFTCAPYEGCYFTELYNTSIIYINGEKEYLGTWTTVYQVDQGGEWLEFGTVNLTLEEPQAKYGDVNGDGVIDGRDLIRLRKYLDSQDASGASPYEIFAGADVTEDGVIDGRDLIRLRKYLAEDCTLTQD